MAKFTVRVELHGAKSEDVYEVLHKAMEEQGFITYIVDSDTGVAYQLPRAEYNKIGDYTKKQIINYAHIAAKKTGLNYSILVTASAGRVWYNLEEI